MIRSFRCNDHEETEVPHHHEDTDAFEKQFREDVKSLCNFMRELGNPFTNTEGELLHIISKTIIAKEFVDSFKNALSIRENQYTNYVLARIITVSTSKSKMKAVLLKDECNLFA